MNRFRKKSDAKRSQVSTTTRTNSPTTLPELPPASDFRTSLILPDLSRRFTLLRTSAGEPFTLDDLKSRFAEQRAKGIEHHISEEEEDMILETLGRIRARNSGMRESSDTRAEYSSGIGRYSVRSTDTEITEASSISGSVTSSPSGRSPKRYSNNLFGSGRFRDHSYLRSVASQQSKAASTRSTHSFAPTESSASLKNADDLRPSTPEQYTADSTQSSPEKDPDSHQSSQDAADEDALVSSEHLATTSMTPSALRHASRALEKVIKEIEEEGEDEIVMPRTAPAPRHNGTTDHNYQGAEEMRQSVSESSTTSGDVEAGMAISSDNQVRPEPESHRVSPVPFRIAPGYIPGMPRPMTPRDNTDFDDRSHSTTPRATSPAYATFAEPSSPTSPTTKTPTISRLGRNSPSSQSPRPTSPLASSPFLSRSSNGRHTPDYSSRGTDGVSIEFESPLNSTVLGRRRPASPLSGPAYQPLTVSSHPSTPSNITWSPLVPNAGHSRDGSWTSDSGLGFDLQQPLNQSASTTCSLRSPLPDSSTLDGASKAEHSNSQSSNGSALPDLKPFLPISRIDIGSPPFPRSPTPTQTGSRSPTSQTFQNETARNDSNRNSRQTAPASPTMLTTFPSLAFSPLANSSRSSLESNGSSYHSSEADNLKYRGLTIFSEIDPHLPAWHEFPPDSSSTTPGGSPDDDWDMEDIIARYAGLNKSDFMAIQEKLVGAAVAKAAPPESRERVPSLRRRRPSTSQSNYSLNGRAERIASPLPQTQPAPPASLMAASSDQVAKVNALLNSVVDSIQSASPPLAPGSVVEHIASTQSDRDISPTTRKNRDLAQVLFGDEPDNPEEPTTPLALPEVTSLQPISKTPASPNVDRSSPATVLPTTITPLKQLRNPSTPRLPQSPEEAAELHRAVQMQADAATRALRKPPSASNLVSEGATILSSGTISRKRISPGQIGSPTLVSSSASVDAIPLRPPSSSSGNYGAPSKISQRFRRFRGTLKSKPPPQIGGEITPYPLDPSGTSPIGQAVTYDPTKLNPGKHVPSSATDFGRAKVSVPSPPASASPGIKGFMARFRSKRALESHQEQGRRPTSQQTPTTSHRPTSPSSHRRPATADSAPMLSQPPPSPPQHSTIQGAIQPVIQENPSESIAIKQLFEAAEALSVDRQALSALLRSASVSSKVTLTRNPSVTRAPQPDIPEQRPTSSVAGVGGARPSVDSELPSDDHRVKKGSVRRHVDSLRPARESSDAPSSSVVRRTIILASDTRSSSVDLSTLLRKGSNRRKRISAQSFSNRSVHDRVPTPPPPRSAAARRFSHDQSPPVPHFPGSSSQGDYLAIPSASGTASEKPISAAYDSLYDMYTGDRTQNAAGEYDPAQLPPHETPLNPEAGTALEVIELANGETIWSIVNGLRDDDVESVYAHRSSFASEYSSRENGDGVQVFFKEHNRSSSKSSATSFLSRKKSQAKYRPETKIFYSSPAQIGRLIEDISQGMDAGSFNILPTKQAGHSSASSVSEANWTVEERLEHMLGTIGAK